MKHTHADCHQLLKEVVKRTLRVHFVYSQIFVDIQLHAVENRKSVSNEASSPVTLLLPWFLIRRQNGHCVCVCVCKLGLTFSLGYYCQSFLDLECVSQQMVSFISPLNKLRHETGRLRPYLESVLKVDEITGVTNNAISHCLIFWKDSFIRVFFFFTGRSFALNSVFTNEVHDLFIYLWVIYSVQLQWCVGVSAVVSLSPSLQVSSLVLTAASTWWWLVCVCSCWSVGFVASQIKSRCCWQSSF